jgi:hypothetical protein
MSMFTVRVELFGKAAEDDYEKLHEKMQAKRFFRVVKGEKAWYHLPSATYDHAADSSASEVRNQVWAIAKAAWSDPGVLVTEANSMSWMGLRKATAEEVKELTSVLK